MDEHTVRSLNQRLERAEREKRWWRAVSLVVLALCVFLVVLVGFARRCW